MRPYQRNSSGRNDRPAEAGSPGGGKPLWVSVETSGLKSDRVNLKKSFIIHLRSLQALTDIRTHLEQRGCSVRDNSRHKVTAWLLQVRQAGSQPLAQPVTGAGVASVTSLGPLIHERTSRRLGHGAVPGEKTRPRNQDIIYSALKWVWIPSLL